MNFKARWLTACAVLFGLVAGLSLAPASADGPPLPPSAPQRDATARTPVKVPPDMNESVVQIPADDAAHDNLTLETTVFKPEGDGPFPVVIFNHGKERGDPRDQARSRPLSFARVFVQRGYLVVVPNREGFAHSGGVYTETMCGIDELGQEQARDVAATVRYVKSRPDADAHRIIVAGASEGGLATMAYGMNADPGVVALINFSGGLRQDACLHWKTAMIDAFANYGRTARLPSLWFYGDNDAYWPQSLARSMLEAYRNAGGEADYVDFGNYKDNAHRLSGDRDGVSIWWPSVAQFLQHVGLPTRVRDDVPMDMPPPPTGYAALEDVQAVPYLDDAGRAGYETFLHQFPSRAFALSESGAWSWAEGGDDPMSVALDNCQRNSHEPCHLYAVDTHVVWQSRPLRAEGNAGKKPQ